MIMNLRGKVINNKYYVRKKLGEDDFSIKWEARLVLADNKVKLSFLKKSEDSYTPDYIKQLKNRMEAVKGLIHPGIVKVMECGEYQNHFFIVSEYIDGINLMDYIKRYSFVTIMDKIYIMIQICKALDYAHQQRLAHNNLSLNNIWIIEHVGNINGIKIADIGFAPFIFSTGNKESRTHLTVPEDKQQIPAFNPVDDIYHLGLVFFWLLAGRIPEKTEPPSTYNEKIPPLIDNLISQLISEDVEARCQSIDEFLQFLIKIRQGETLYNDLFYQTRIKIKEEELPDQSRQQVKKNQLLKKKNRDKEKNAAAMESREKTAASEAQKQESTRSISSLKKIFEQSYNGKGQIVLFSQEQARHWKNVFDYFYYFIPFNGGVYLDILYTKNNIDQPFYVFKQILQYYEKQSRKSKNAQNAMKIQLLTDNLSDAFRQFICNNLGLKGILGIDSPATGSEKIQEIEEELMDEAARFVCELTMLKSPLVLFFHNILYIDEYSNNFLSFVKERIDGFPFLVFGIIE